MCELVDSAIAAAKENYIDADKAIITTVLCNEGPRLKRQRPKSKGQSMRINHRMSHLTLVATAAEETKTAVKEKRAPKPEEKPLESKEKTTKAGETVKEVAKASKKSTSRKAK